MANQQNTFELTKPTARYEMLDFGEYDESLAGQGFVFRVNPNRAVIRALEAAWQTTRANAGEAGTLTEQTNIEFVNIAAQLIPADDENLEGASIDPAAFQTFIFESDDLAFSLWVLKTMFEKVRAHFLAPNASRKGFKRGRVP